MEINYQFPQRIADLCLNKFSTLPKKGKSTEKEWTVLSAFVKLESDKLYVVSMGTGTKCLAGNESDFKGRRLHDSHAEIMARRGFLRYLLSNDDLFHQLPNEKMTLKPNISFHFFTTHSPCGDASILTDDQGTGARLINCDGDSMIQTLGHARTKPGRGFRTLSMSCSDKITRWNVMGVQGGNLSHIMEPIYLKSYTVLGSPTVATALERAILRWKFEVALPFIQMSHKVYSVDRHFEYCQKPDLSPSACSIVWIDGNIERPLEVAVNGDRMGLTKKAVEKSNGLLISRKELGRQFQEKCKKLKIEVPKKKDEEYVQAWRKILRDHIKSWKSPDFTEKIKLSTNIEDDELRPAKRLKS